MIGLIKRYRVFLGLCLLNLILLLAEPATGRKALSITSENLLEMLSFLPPIFVLLGLLDVWIDRETMMRYMGENSGLRGHLLAFALGSAAAGPLYAAFPIVGVLLKKNASMMNVFIFVGAWSTTKIPLLVFESATLGFHFMALRFVFNVIGILIIAWIMKIQAKGEKLPIQE
ncbi:MAG: permease [Desulfovibrio sp.]|nr:permease [Desulfovibrio sp.]